MTNLPAQLFNAAVHECQVLGRNARVASRRTVARAEPDQVLDQRRAIKRHEELFGELVAPLAPQVQRTLERLCQLTFHLTERIVLRSSLAVVANLYRERGNRGHQFALVGKDLIGQAQRMHFLHQLGALRRDHQLEPGLHKGAVQADVDIRNARHRGEATIVLCVVFDDLADIVQRAALKARDIVAARELGVVRIGGLVLDDRFVKPRREHVDHVDIVGELAVLFVGDLARDKDTQVTDAFVHAVDNGLAMRLDLLVVFVQIDDPAQGLRGRGNVVALRTEHDDRRVDVAQVDAGAVARDQFGCRKPVTDEQVIDNELDFLAVEVHMAAPPPLEAKVALGFRVDIGVQVVLLGKVRVARVEVFKVLHQVGAVELAVAQVACHHREPRPARKATGVTHRILAAPAGPIGKRCARDDDRPEELGTNGGGHHDLPARLAVADDHRLAFSLRVQGNHFLHEVCLGLDNIVDCLVRLGIRKKADEITGVAGLHCDADFAFGLESRDAGTMSRTRIDDDERPLDRVDRHGFRRHDAGQHIVDGAGQIVTVHHELGLHAEHVGRLLGHVPLVLVPALTHDVGVQNAALPGIRQIFGCCSHQRGHEPDTVARLALVGNSHGRLLGSELPLR